METVTETGSEVLIDVQDHKQNPIEDGFNFNNGYIRANFYLKVFWIIGAQFTATSILTYYFLFDDNVKIFIKKNFGVLIVAGVLLFMVLLIVGFCGELRREFPVNYAILISFTLSKAFLIACLSTAFDTLILLVTCVMICITCFGLGLFANLNFIKFNVWKGLLFSFILHFVVLVTILATAAFHLEITVSTSVSFCVTGYYIYDIQLMAKKKHVYDLQPYECIFAAVSVFIDFPQVIYEVCLCKAVSGDIFRSM
ncbi:protein lifeguard 3-like [Diabrotica virgifera virgifera]|uniref:Protein lifeguard 3-like n=1 Tax=Diabrotica virgifera virgifera TaxID=50390 RepID=A0A6P7G709_DIAVI|nr:protein lifeguard 3-like [Diabrotica virgifera virgifera]